VQTLVLQRDFGQKDFRSLLQQRRLVQDGSVGQVHGYQTVSQRLRKSEAPQSLVAVL